jgi:hypothetical protein
MKTTKLLIDELDLSLLLGTTAPFMARPWVCASPAWLRGSWRRRTTTTGTQGHSTHSGTRREKTGTT